MVVPPGFLISLYTVGGSGEISLFLGAGEWGENPMRPNFHFSISIVHSVCVLTAAWFGALPDFFSVVSARLRYRVICGDLCFAGEILR